MTGVWRMRRINPPTPRGKPKNEKPPLGLVVFFSSLPFLYSILHILHRDLIFEKREKQCDLFWSCGGCGG
jgi:hypothetical protein